MPPNTTARPPARRRRGRLSVRRAIPLAVLAAISTLAVATASFAHPPSIPASLDPNAFGAVAMADGGATMPPPTIEFAMPAAAPDIGDFQEDDVRSFAPRANPDQAVEAESVLKPTPKPKPEPTPPPNPSHSASGRAAWYCNNGSGCPAGYSGGLYAAAGAALRVGNWRGRVVTVCGNGNCVNVKLVDWCACGGARIIDLFGAAYGRLAPLSTGTVAVKVSW
jgi:rare lipoprotein A (RlpA)-like double-psi beta-barrel protein